MNLPWVYVICAICETYVVLWFSRDLCLIGGGDGVSLPCHSTICETVLVYGSPISICALCTLCDLWGGMVLHVSMVNWQGEVVIVLHGSMVNWQGGQSVMGICAFCNI